MSRFAGYVRYNMPQVQLSQTTTHRCGGVEPGSLCQFTTQANVGFVKPRLAQNRREAVDHPFGPYAGSLFPPNKYGPLGPIKAFYKKTKINSFTFKIFS